MSSHTIHSHSCILIYTNCWTWKFSPFVPVLQINSAYIKQLIRSGDLEKLQNLVLEGQGKRLIGAYSPDYKIRSYLKSVPSIMVSLKFSFKVENQFIFLFFSLR